MNHFKYPGSLFRLAYSLALRGRWIINKPICKSFGRMQEKSPKTIQQIHVINLDRQSHRWHQMQRELQQIYDANGTPLLEITKRFPAIDAKEYVGLPSESLIDTYYSLADQLCVEPQPTLSIARVDIDQRIQMTRQEIAVALSHIEVWKRIAAGDDGYTLVLEDDVYFQRNFAKYTDQAWNDLKDAYGSSPPFDILYLSYKEAKTRALKSDVTDFVFRPYRGLWYLSGYVLSKVGARKLLSLLPIRGPVDLWINHQFEALNVFATSKSVINQRMDYRSDNSYSILPVLTKIGILSKETPILFENKPPKGPIFAFGMPNTGLTSLAMALSMLGYRCCSDVNELTKSERVNLFANKRKRIFDAYVNVGSLYDHYLELAKLYPNAYFFVTLAEDDKSESNQKNWGSCEFLWYKGSLGHIHRLIKSIQLSSDNLMIVPTEEPNKWKSICKFLDCVPPTCQYPTVADKMQRELILDPNNNSLVHLPQAYRLKFDSLPWIVNLNRNWSGIPTDGANFEALPEEELIRVCKRSREFNNSFWFLRNDTFPSNLALFTPSNYSTSKERVAQLTLRKERSGVRDYTSASISSRNGFLYGRFEAEIRPAKISGIITGVFLHRNSPRQEIDIEFLGKDTTKMLLNVYYNPGSAGARFEYGYRGTPVLIDLGFDASEDFHRYRVDWSPTAIQWFVDDQLIHKRFNWEPTPIPHLPMQFHVNLWPSRSVELAGRLLNRKLPTSSAIKSIKIDAFGMGDNKEKQRLHARNLLDEAAI